MKKILFVLLSTAAFAAINPTSSKEDKRIQFAEFNANQVYEIRAQNGFISMLKFEPNERVINIVCGFLDGWQIKADENFLFIKPKAYVARAKEQTMLDSAGNAVTFADGQDLVIQPTAKDWKTNLIITTNKRIYVFDLILSNAKNVSYRVDFKYQQEIDKKAQKLAKIAAKRAAVDKKLDEQNFAKNYNYLMHVNKNSEEIAPDYAYDDGIFTYLGFSANKTIPSVFEFDSSNKESILNAHVKQDGNFKVLVIQKVPKMILLRSGSKLVGVRNDSYMQQETAYQNTIKSDVKRILK